MVQKLLKFISLIQQILPVIWFCLQTYGITCSVIMLHDQTNYKSCHITSITSIHFHMYIIPYW